MFAQKTMTFVRAPDENVFIPPFNLIEIFVLAIPLEWWIPKRTFERLNDIVMGIIYSPLLLISAYFEMRWAEGIRMNRARGDADDDTIEEWEQALGHINLESDGWKKKVDNAKSNFEVEPAVAEIRQLRDEVAELKKLIASLHRVLGEAKAETVGETVGETGGETGGESAET